MRNVRKVVRVLGIYTVSLDFRAVARIFLMAMNTKGGLDFSDDLFFFCLLELVVDPEFHTGVKFLNVDYFSNF